MKLASSSLARRIGVVVALAVLPGVTALAADSKASRFYEDALVRFEKKDFAGSIVQLKNAIKVEPGNLAVQMLLGKALLADSQVVAAEVAFNEALKLGINRIEVVLPMAHAVVAQGRLQEVATDPRFDPSGLPPGLKSQVLLVKAAAHADLGNAAEAMRAIAEARALDANAPDSFLVEVQVRTRARQFSEAMVAADRAIALGPAVAEAHYLRGSVLHVQGQAALALAAYDKAVQLQPSHAEARIARAGLHLDQNKLDDVMRDVSEVRRLSPKDPRAPYLSSVVAERRKDSKAARDALAEVTAFLDPVPIEFMKYRPQLLVLGGLAHYGLGQLEKARPYLEAALRAQPSSPVGKLLGQILISTKNPDSAIETLEAYLKYHPTDQHATVLLASAQMSKGRSARAAQLLQDAVKAKDSPQLRTLLGMMLVGGGKLNTATAELEAAFKRDPSQVVAGAALVELYLADRQLAKAQQVADLLVKRSPGDAQMHMLLGLVREQTGDAIKARQAYEAALKLDTDFLPAQLGMARLDRQAGAIESAAKRLDAILAKNDKHVEALMELALLAERQNRWDDAAKMLDKAADHSANADLKAAFALLNLHLRRGNLDLAQKALDRLNNKAPENFGVLMANADVRLATKDVTGARQVLTRASRTAEFDAKLQTQVALKQLQAGDAKGAQYSLSKALQAQPDAMAAKALMVDVSLRLGEVAEAEQAARQIAAAHPKLPIGHSLVGDVAMARAQVPVAIDAYRRAHQLQPSGDSLRRLFSAMVRQDAASALQLADRWVKANPTDAQTLRLLGDTHARAGAFKPAQAAYEALVKVAPDDADALNNLANLLLLSKDPGALKVAEAALAKKPGAAYIIGTTGWAAFQAGQTDRGLQLLRDARLRDPANADTRYFLAAALASKGRPAEARDELQAALKAGVSNTYAKEAQALLQTLR